MEQVKSFTEGKILGPLIKFTIPVMIALVLQSLYGAVDLMIVGQYSNSAQVSAVATGSQIMMTLTHVIAGLSMGTTILLGHQIGEGRSKEAGKSMGASIVFFAIVALLCSTLMLLNVRSVADIMNAPKEAFKDTCSYIQICSWGFIFVVAYNLIGSLFRGLGNSKVPLITVAIAAVFNVFGDLFLVGYFNMGASGAAYATVGAQAISVVISMFMVKGMHLPFEMHKEDIRFDMPITKELLKYGLPLALADFLVGLSFLIILAIVNSLGVIASAGVGVAEKVCGFIMLIPSSFGQSMAAFVAQNYGAKKLDRAHKALCYGIAVSLVIGASMGLFAFFKGDLLCGLFAKDPAAIQAGWDYLKAYAIDTVLTSFFFCMNGYFNGCGETKFVMAQNIIGAFCVRVPVSYLMSLVTPVSLFYIGLATPSSSLLQVIMCLIYFFTVAKKKEKAYLETTTA